MGAGAENCEGALRKNYCLLCEIDPTVRTGGKVQIVLSPFPAYYFRTAPLGRCVSTHESRRDSKANAAYPSRLVWWKSVKGRVPDTGQTRRNRAKGQIGNAAPHDFLHKVHRVEFAWKSIERPVSKMGFSPNFPRFRAFSIRAPLLFVAKK